MKNSRTNKKRSFRKVSKRRYNRKKLTDNDRMKINNLPKEFEDVA